MAITLYTAKLIRQVFLRQQLQRLQQSEQPNKFRAAMFSCHDLLLTRPQLENVFGPDVEELPYREDSEAIIAWHKARAWLPGVVDTSQLFKACGWDLDCFDVVRARGCEIIKDLNEPFSQDWLGTYDFVYDNSLGQLFNVAQGIRSAIELLKEGGHLLSVTPANSPNHGFYSISPTFYHDVLKQNGCEIVVHNVVESIVKAPNVIPFTATTGCNIPYGAHNVVVAKRTAVQPFKYPTQSKFLKSPNSKG